MACLFDEVESIIGLLSSSSSEYDKSDANIIKDVLAKVRDFTSKVPEYEAKPEQKAVIHSGGALGADHVFDAIGSNYGLNTNHYYFGEIGKPTYGTHHITEVEYIQGLIMVNKAAKILNRNPGNNLSLLARNWMQVRNADVVVAVASFIQDKDGNNTSKVNGGTGWAVAMAEAVNKPVLVYNMTDGLWYESSANSEGKRIFTIVEGTPKLPEGTKNIAGIGTRSVEYEFSKDDGTNGATIEARSKAFGAIEKFIATNFGDKIGDDVTITIMAGSKEDKVTKYGERDVVYIDEVPGVKTSKFSEGVDMDEKRSYVENMFKIGKLSAAINTFLSGIKGKVAIHTDSTAKHSWLYKLIQDTANDDSIKATVVSDHMKSMLEIFKNIRYENNITSKINKDKSYTNYRVNADGTLSTLTDEEIKSTKAGIFAMRVGNKPIESFGNPFVTRTNLANNVDSIFVGGNNKASYEYFMWLTDDNYKYPEGTTDAIKATLDARKKWILNGNGRAKFDALAADTVEIYIQYNGTGKGSDINHVKAMIAASRVRNGKDIGIPNTDLPTIENEIEINNDTTSTTERIDWKDFIQNFYLPANGVSKGGNYTDKGAIDSDGNYSTNSTEIHKDARKDSFIKSKTRAEKKIAAEDDFSTEITRRFKEEISKRSKNNVVYNITTINNVLDGTRTGTVVQEVRRVLIEAAEATMEAIENSGNPDFVGAFNKPAVTKEESSIISNTKDRDNQALNDIEVAMRMSEENKKNNKGC